MSFLHLIDFILQTGHRHFTNITTGMFVPVWSSASGDVAPILIHNLCQKIHSQKLKAIYF